VTGPAEAPRPPGARVIEVGTAREMLAATLAALPADVAVFAAAVADWHVPGAGGAKLKKDPSGVPPAIALAENPDILATVAKLPAGRRPRLVIGFAAETDAVVANAEAKLARKGADWIVANDVSPATGIMGGTENAVTLVTAAGAEPWPRLSKEETAERLVDRIAAALA
jgi:phosphopantothenoylcysteine decarboxylase/phosphopantothenate--cysteine ligase